MTQLPPCRPPNLEIREGVTIEDENLWVWDLYDQFRKDL